MIFDCDLILQKYKREFVHMNTGTQEWKLKEVLDILKQHSKIYIIKFFALVALAFISTILLAADHHGLFVSSLTFVSSLLFDQMTKNKLDENFDFKKVGNLCNMGIVYISIIFIVSYVS